jgi:hypothetical protein
LQQEEKLHDLKQLITQQKQNYAKLALTQQANDRLARQHASMFVEETLKSREINHKLKMIYRESKETKTESFSSNSVSV